MKSASPDEGTAKLFFGGLSPQGDSARSITMFGDEGATIFTDAVKDPTNRPRA